MKRRCKACNGTGKESCEVHGSHICSTCNGKGCTDGWNAPWIDFKPTPYRTQPIRCTLWGTT